jgi:hypothetical protein
MQVVQRGWETFLKIAGSLRRFLHNHPPSFLDDKEVVALQAVVPDLPSVPVQPIIFATQEEPGMFDFYRHFPSFLKVRRYASQEQLIAELGDRVIRPAELNVLDLQSST